MKYLTVILLTLASCDSQSATPASFRDPITAIDVAAEAMTGKNYATAVDGYRYAFEQVSDPKARLQTAQELFKALAMNNQGEAAKTLLTQLHDEFGEQVDGVMLRGLTEWSLNKHFANLAHFTFDCANDWLTDSELEYYQPEVAWDGIQMARAGDYDSLARLGYVGDEAVIVPKKVKPDETDADPPANEN